MSKKHKHKKQSARSPHVSQHIVFTLSEVRMLKDALRLVESSLLRNVKPLPHLELAQETIEGLKIKLDTMLQLEEWERETPLDHNELHILYAAIHMYLAHLSINKENSLLTLCLALCKQFSFLIEDIRNTS